MVLEHHIYQINKDILYILNEYSIYYSILVKSILFDINYWLLKLDAFKMFYFVQKYILLISSIAPGDK